MVTMPMPVQLRDILRRKIILGEYAQGEILSEPRLAADLGVSRVPIREVMPQLRQEGFVDTSPRRRSAVIRWTAEGIHQLFDARLGVEVAAAGAAARRPDREDAVSILIAAIETAESHSAAGAEIDVALGNADVHVAFAAAAGNPLFDELMRVLSGRLAWLFYLTSSRDIAGQHHEHHAIVEAIREGNVRLAEALTYSHIESGRRPTLEALAETGMYTDLA